MDEAWNAMESDLEWISDQRRLDPVSRCGNWGLKAQIAAWKNYVDSTWQPSSEYMYHVGNSGSAEHQYFIQTLDCILIHETCVNIVFQYIYSESAYPFDIDLLSNLEAALGPPEWYENGRVSLHSYTDLESAYSVMDRLEDHGMKAILFSSDFLEFERTIPVYDEGKYA